MGSGLIRLTRGTQEWFLEWSTSADAPSTFGMSEAELRAWTRDEYGRVGLRDLDARIERCRETGTSFYDDTLDVVIAHNRAGRGERHLSRAGLIRRYCLERPDADAAHSQRLMTPAKHRRLHKAIESVTVNRHRPDCIEWVSSERHVWGQVRNDRVLFKSFNGATFDEVADQIIAWTQSDEVQQSPAEEET